MCMKYYIILNEHNYICAEGYIPHDEKLSNNQVEISKDIYEQIQSYAQTGEYLLKFNKDTLSILTEKYEQLKPPTEVQMLAQQITDLEILILGGNKNA